jgi:hypothetical protein
MVEVLSGPQSNLTARYRSNGLSLSSSPPNTDGEDDPRTHSGTIAVHNQTSILCIQIPIRWDLHDKEVIASDQVRFVPARRQRAALSSAYGGFKAWSKTNSELPSVQVTAVPQFSPGYAEVHQQITANLPICRQQRRVKGLAATGPPDLSAHRIPGSLRRNSRQAVEQAIGRVPIYPRVGDMKLWSWFFMYSEFVEGRETFG